MTEIILLIIVGAWALGTCQLDAARHRYRGGRS